MDPRRARPLRPPTRPAGLTLVELVVVIALLALLVSVSAPALRQLLEAQRVRAAASALHLALLQARSEALKRNTVVTLRPATGNGWAGELDLVATVDGMPRQIEAVPAPGPLQVLARPAVEAVAFGPDGRPRGAAVRFTLTSLEGEAVRCLWVDPAGRVQAHRGAAC